MAIEVADWVVDATRLVLRTNEFVKMSMVRWVSGHKGYRDAKVRTGHNIGVLCIQEYRLDHTKC